MTQTRIDWYDLSQVAGTVLAVFGLGAIIAAGVWLKYASPRSDYQRLNALEQKVQALSIRVDARHCPEVEEDSSHAP